MPYGKSYSKEKAAGVPMNQRRAPAQRVSYDNTKRRVASGSNLAGMNKLAHVKPTPKP